MLVIQHDPLETSVIHETTVSIQTFIQELLATRLDSNADDTVTVTFGANAVCECRGLPPEIKAFRVLKPNTHSSYITGYTGGLLHRFPAVRVEIETADDRLTEMELITGLSEAEAQSLLRSYSV